MKQKHKNLVEAIDKMVKIEFPDNKELELSKEQAEEYTSLIKSTAQAIGSLITFTHDLTTTNDDQPLNT